MGISGSGKSGLINLLTQSQLNSVFSTRAVSRRVRFSQPIVIETDQGHNSVVLCDTVGLGDQQLSVHQILAQINIELSREVKCLHKVLVCLKMDRLRSRLIGDINLVVQYLQALGVRREQFLVVVTYCDLFSEQLCDDFYGRMIHHDLPLLRSFSRIFVSLPQEGEVRPEFREFVAAMRKQAYDSILDFLNEDTPSTKLTHIGDDVFSCREKARSWMQTRRGLLLVLFLLLTIVALVVTFASG